MVVYQRIFYTVVLIVGILFCTSAIAEVLVDPIGLAVYLDADGEL